MKLQLDTAEKTIKVLEDVSLDALVKVLNGILPNGEWKKYKLQMNVTVTWGYPIYVDRWWWEGKPHTYPWVTYGTGTTTITNTDGANVTSDTCVYNIDVN